MGQRPPMIVSGGSGPRIYFYGLTGGTGPNIISFYRCPGGGANLYGVCIFFPARQEGPPGSSTRPLRPETLPSDLADRLFRVGRPRSGRDFLLRLRPRRGVSCPREAYLPGDLHRDRHGHYGLRHFGELRPDHREVPHGRGRVHPRRQAARGEGGGWSPDRPWSSITS